jgi:hypothetical protein
MDMAHTAHADRARAALMDLPRQLDELWRDPRFTPSERRRLLRAMWDDLGDDADAMRARDIIRAFARVHLSAEEAAAFN